MSDNQSRRRDVVAIGLKRFLLNSGLRAGHAACRSRLLRAAKRQLLRALLCGGILSASLVGAVPSAWAETYDVHSSATFAQALQHANSGDVINITGSFTMEASVAAINTNLTIQGNNHTIDAAYQYRPFFVESGTVAISGLTIKDGFARGGDGGMYLGGGGMGAVGAIFVNSGASVMLSDVAFSDNVVLGGYGTGSSGLSSGGGGGRYAG